MVYLTGPTIIILQKSRLTLMLRFAYLDPDFNPMGTGGSFPGDKAAGA